MRSTSVLLALTKIKYLVKLGSAEAAQCGTAVEAHYDSNELESRGAEQAVVRSSLYVLYLSSSVYVAHSETPEHHYHHFIMLCGLGLMQCTGRAMTQESPTQITGRLISRKQMASMSQPTTSNPESHAATRAM